MIYGILICKHSGVHKEAYDTSDIYEPSFHLTSPFVLCRQSVLLLWNVSVWKTNIRLSQEDSCWRKTTSFVWLFFYVWRFCDIRIKTWIFRLAPLSEFDPTSREFLWIKIIITFIRIKQRSVKSVSIVIISWNKIRIMNSISCPRV